MLGLSLVRPMRYSRSMTPYRNYKIAATYDDVLKVAEPLVGYYPDRVTPASYLGDATHTPCFAASILRILGFDPPLTWWQAPRYDGGSRGQFETPRYMAHIRFLFPEIFENEDLRRDALLRKIQDYNDSGHRGYGKTGASDRAWSVVLRAAKAYVARLDSHDIIESTRIANALKETANV